MRPTGTILGTLALLASAASSVDAVLRVELAWTESGPGASRYGHAATTAGDVNGDGYSDLLVGAPEWTNGHTGEGRIYLYYGSATGLQPVPWTFETNHASSALGASLAPAGDVNADGYGDFLAGAPNASHGEFQEGRVYLFAGGPNAPTLIRTFESNESGAHMGRSVGWAGDVNDDGYDDVLIGAPEWGGFGSPVYVPVQGAASVYHGGPEGPDGTADWSRLGGQEDMGFGHAVAGVGDMNGDGFADILVGAPNYDPGTFDTNHGIVRCYMGSASGLETTPTWEYVGVSGGDAMGHSVGAAGDIDGDGHADALAGALDAGMYWFLGSTDGYRVVHDYPAKHPMYASSVSTVGDVNADGFADFATGSDVESGDGEVRLWRGVANGVVTSWTDLNAPAPYGLVVGSAGDVNGDGFGDVVVAHWAGTPSVYVYHGLPSWFAHRIDGNVLGTEAEEYGHSVRSAGDVQGDGYDDVIVGAPGHLVGVGAAYLLPGSTDSLSDAEWSVTGTDPDGRLGEAVASAGDVNGDGYDDVIVGVPGSDRVHVYYGSETGLPPTPSWSRTFEFAGARFGAAVDGAGDLNRDGFADIVVGAPDWDGAGPDRGMFRVYNGSAHGLLGTATSFFGSVDGARLGAAVAGVGDVNGDDLDDVVVGAPGAEGDPSATGAAYLYTGWGSPTLVGPAWSVIGLPGEAVGRAVAGAGDTNGDGYADVLVAAPERESTAGGVTLYLGDADPFTTSYAIDPPAGPGARWGSSVGAAGDLTGVGLSDFLITYYDAQGSSKISLAGLRSGSVVMHTEFFVNGTTPNVTAATAGDVDGDGFPEVVAGAPDADSFAPGGRITHYTVHPIQRPQARDVLPRLTTIGGDPIALRGIATDASDIQVQLADWVPAGRGPRRIEWQVTEPRVTPGVPDAAPWVDSGPALDQSIALGGAVATTAIRLRRANFRARREAERQAAISEATNEFLSEDVLAAVSPTRLGREATLREAFDAASASLEGRFDGEPLVEAAIQSTMASTFIHLGDYAAAERHAARQLALLQRALGAEHERVSYALAELGTVRLYQERFAEAESVLSLAHRIQRARLAPDDRRRIETLCDLASAYMMQGQHDRAESVFVGLEARALEALGPDDEATLTVRNNLAMLYGMMRRTDDAMARRLQVLESQRRALGETHPQTLASENNLAAEYIRVWKHEKAADVLLRAIATGEEVLGPTHRSVLRSMGNLARVRVFQDRHQEAEHVARETLVTCHII